MQSTVRRMIEAPRCDRRVSGERLPRDYDAVLVRVYEVARTERHAGEAHRHIALPLAAPLAAQRHRAERAQRERQPGEFRAVADAAVDDHAAPLVLHGGAAKMAAEQRVTTRAAAIDDQDAPLSRTFDRLLDA